MRIEENREDRSGIKIKSLPVLKGKTPTNIISNSKFKSRNITTSPSGNGVHDPEIFVNRAHHESKRKLLKTN